MTAIAERLELHRNGSGRRASTVTCAESVSLDTRTIIEGDGSIWGHANIVRSTVSGSVKISGKSMIALSQITGHCWITDSATIVGCKISAATGEVEIHDNASLDGCTITANNGCRVSIGENAVLRNVTINGECYIAGDAVVQNCELVPGVRIERGRWDRSPRVVRTAAFDVVEDVGDHIFIGCESRPRELWLRSGVKIGLERGYSEAEVREYERIIMNWRT